MPTRILWFRRDLRLHDHPALAAALEPGDGTAVVPLFVVDPRLVGAPRMGAPRLSYLCDALAALDEGLHRRGGRLIVRSGDPRDVVPAVAAETGAAAVHWSAEFTPYGTDRDAAVRAALEGAGVEAHAHPGVLLAEPGSVRTASGDFFRVFSPFQRAWREVPLGEVTPAPGRVPVPHATPGEPLPTPASLGVSLDADVIEGGEPAARARLEEFLRLSADAYHERRNLLSSDGTSRLSADLHYGCVSPRAVYRRLDLRQPGHKGFASELVWRDFYGHVLARWPEVAITEFNPALRDLPWRGASADLDAWCEGRTGYPVIDAAMRQLLGIAWMHNRARMLVASFLCKDLLTDWRLGEAHFLRHLVDGDAASNNGGWQWAAGTGTDAQPYFRIFNPVSQGEQFDPDGAYVRRWVPELRRVPDRWIHHPWDLPDDVTADCGVRIGRDYPAPIVDHAQARIHALAFFKRA